MISLYKFKTGSENGIITSLVKTKSLPKMETNETGASSDLSNDFEGMYTGDSNIVITKSQGPIYLEFDFYHYSVTITDFQIKIPRGHTPAVEWEVLGRNSIDENWSIVYKAKDNTPSLCEIGTTTDYNYQCQETTTTSFSIQHPYGPFRYLRYSVIKDRANVMSNSNFLMFRLKKFEIYGTLCSFSHKLCLNTCFRANSLFSNFPFFITFYQIIFS